MKRIITIEEVYKKPKINNTFILYTIFFLLLLLFFIAYFYKL
jgi:hypothetical protein